MLFVFVRAKQNPVPFNMYQVSKHLDGMAVASLYIWCL
jgi:hypothetical protein